MKETVTYVITNKYIHCKQSMYESSLIQVFMYIFSSFRYTQIGKCLQHSKYLLGCIYYIHECKRTGVIVSEQGGQNFFHSLHKEEVQREQKQILHKKCEQVGKKFKIVKQLCSLNMQILQCRVLLKHKEISIFFGSIQDFFCFVLRLDIFALGN